MRVTDWAARRFQFEEEGPGTLSDPPTSFHDQFGELFQTRYSRLYRYLHRLSGDSELAADVAQEALVRLYQRGALPESPEAWLISVAMNLFRNERTTRSRRERLLRPAHGERILGDPPPAPDEAAEASETRIRVRATLDRLPERDRQLLLLQAEGFGYRDIAVALQLNEASIGVFLARARRAFRKAHEETHDAS